MRRREVQQLSARVDSLLEEFRAADPSTAERAEELVRAVMALYAAGLARVVDVAEGAPDVLRALADDEVVGDLLVLHDLHPDDTDTRIQAALDRVRPYLGSHAGGVEYHGVDEHGTAHLSLQGTCDGCPSSSVTVTTTLEQAVLEAAPDVVEVAVEGMVAEHPSPLLQIGLRPGLEHRPATTPGQATEPGAAQWHLLVDLPEPGHTLCTRADGTPVLLARLADAAYAYRDRCPRCGASPGTPHLVGAVLSCQSCGARFDVRLAGRSADGLEGHLDPLPLLPDGDGWRVSLPAAVPA